MQGDNYPVILSRKGDIEAFLERLPDLIGQAGAVMARVEALLADDNLQAVDDSLRNVREASAELPGLMRNATALAADLRTMDPRLFDPAPMRLVLPPGRRHGA